MRLSDIRDVISHRMWIEISIFSILILGFNSHLVFKSLGAGMVYFPGIFGVDGLIRLLFHPFVHVSGYHFLLDAGAFVLLYFGLEEDRAVHKATYVLIPGIMSFISVNMLSAADIANGFCGLSGIAHGLMAVWGLEMIFSGKSKIASLIILGIIICKTSYELISGQPLFSSMHLGQIGQPIPASHAGGVVGGMLSFALIRLSGRPISLPE